jgi:hypothetical protein
LLSLLLHKVKQTSHSSSNQPYHVQFFCRISVLPPKKSPQASLLFFLSLSLPCSSRVLLLSRLGLNEEEHVLI